MKNNLLIALVLLLALLIGAVTIALYIYYADYQRQSQPQSSEPSQGTQTSDTQPHQSQPPTQGQPQDYEIEIEDFAFAPTTLTIKKGDSVMWKNRDSVSHTVTSDSGEEINSQSLNIDQTYSHTFSNPGTYTYHCTPHPRMKGTIIVE